MGRQAGKARRRETKGLRIERSGERREVYLREEGVHIHVPT